MSWVGLNPTDWVTNNNAQDAVNTGVFTLKSGQSIPANTNWITKSEAFSKLNINDIGGVATSWMTKNQFVSSTSYYKVNTYLPSGQTQSPWAYNNTVNNSGAACSLTMYWPEADLYTYNSSGIIEVGDTLLGQDKYAAPSGWYTYYVPDGRKAYLRVTNYPGYTNILGYVAEKGYCSALTANTIAISYSGWNPTGYYNVFMSAQYAVTSNITITIVVTGDVSSSTQHITVSMLSGQSSAEQEGQLVGFQSNDTISVALAGTSPTSDSTYNYYYNLT